MAPLHIVRADDKKKARLNCISHLLDQIKHEDLQREELHLGKRNLK